MLELLPLSTPSALSYPLRADDETLRITIQTKKEKKKGKEPKETKEKDEADEPRVCEEPRQGIALLSGTYNPRRASYGTLRQYTLVTEDAFLDYFKGNGTTKAEVIGLGMGAGEGVLTRKLSRKASLSLDGGWGIYHARGNGSETKLAWIAAVTLNTAPGLVARLQILDTKLQKGDLRGSSLSVGWRF